VKYAELDHYVEYLRKFPRFSSRDYLQLHRIRALLRELGHPERRLRGFQVAGTNGKGSTVAMLDSVLRAAGYRVGAFYSPHLVSYTERFQINGRPISRKRLSQIITRLQPAVERVSQKVGDRPTWFEVITAAGAVYFAESKIDWVVFEVGLGGRLDATTALGLKYKCITEIGYDHMHILGTTIRRIAREKAGIITGRNTVITSNTGEALQVIQNRCRKTHSRLYESPAIKNQQLSVTGTVFSFIEAGESYRAAIRFVGERQAINAAMVFRLMRERLALPSKTILLGLKNATLAGRFQIIKKKPIIIIDGAHNVPAIQYLLRTLTRLGIERNRLITVFGAKTRKNYRAMARLLARRSKTIIFPKTGLPNMAAPQNLKRLLPASRVVPSLRSALRLAQTKANKNDMILITGSFYLIGEVLRERGYRRTASVDRIDDNQIEQKP